MITFFLRGSSFFSRILSSYVVHCKVDTFNCPNGTSYGETGQLVYEKDIRKMCDLTTDVMRNPTFT